ncbi:hypothetical protein ADUPG1_010366 [Aduncisulcus paluster]|uniref:Lebercilin domain-containing protein n=1 Tax=Aduncisulcus paluster TaxID=2918883 RepID=A0ABQ5JR39_9EUKA|nr:hypothetical protein ADUPG1_010366 [Aduncisulcus paluster]
MSHQIFSQHSAQDYSSDIPINSPSGRILSQKERIILAAKEIRHYREREAILHEELDQTKAEASSARKLATMKMRGPSLQMRQKNRRDRWLDFVSDDLRRESTRSKALSHHLDSSSDFSSTDFQFSKKVPISLTAGQSVIDLKTQNEKLKSMLIDLEKKRKAELKQHLANSSKVHSLEKELIRIRRGGRTFLEKHSSEMKGALSRLNDLTKSNQRLRNEATERKNYITRLEETELKQHLANSSKVHSLEKELIRIRRGGRTFLEKHSSEMKGALSRLNDLTKSNQRLRNEATERKNYITRLEESLIKQRRTIVRLKKLAAKQHETIKLLRRRSTISQPSPIESIGHDREHPLRSMAEEEESEPEFHVSMTPVDHLSSISSGRESNRIVVNPQRYSSDSASTTTATSGQMGHLSHSTRHSPSPGQTSLPLPPRSRSQGITLKNAPSSLQDQITSARKTLFRGKPSSSIHGSIHVGMSPSVASTGIRPREVTADRVHFEGIHHHSDSHQHYSASSVSDSKAHKASFSHPNEIGQNEDSSHYRSKDLYSQDSEKGKVIVNGTTGSFSKPKIELYSQFDLHPGLHDSNIDIIDLAKDHSLVLKSQGIPRKSTPSVQQRTETRPIRQNIHQSSKSSTFPHHFRSHRDDHQGDDYQGTLSSQVPSIGSPKPPLNVKRRSTLPVVNRARIIHSHRDSSSKPSDSGDKTYDLKIESPVLPSSSHSGFIDGDGSYFESFIRVLEGELDEVQEKYISPKQRQPQLNPKESEIKSHKILSDPDHREEKDETKGFTDHSPQSGHVLNSHGIHINVNEDEEEFGSGFEQEY